MDRNPTSPFLQSDFKIHEYEAHTDSYHLLVHFFSPVYSISQNVSVYTASICGDTCSCCYPIQIKVMCGIFSPGILSSKWSPSYIRASMSPWQPPRAACKMDIEIGFLPGRSGHQHIIAMSVTRHYCYKPASNAWATANYWCTPNVSSDVTFFYLPSTKAGISFSHQTHKKILPQPYNK